MRDLKVTGIDGTHLQLVDQDGGRYRLPVDDRVRQRIADTASADAPEPAGAEIADPAEPGDSQTVGRAADPADPSVGQSVAPVLTEVPSPPGRAQSSEVPALPPGELVTPRTVQELLRAGHSTEQVAAAASWELAKVERYAAPIEAERSYVAGLARDLPVAASSGDAAATVAQRVAGRLHDRGVTAESVAWDAYRTAGSGWIVVCRFSAGGRGREASWQFRPTTRTLTAIDDEARWLGEDERASGGPVPSASTPAMSVKPVKPVKVFDVEAEGGVTEPVDLVSAMQARSRDRRSRGARTRGGRVESASPTPVDQEQIDIDGSSAAPDPANAGQQFLPSQQPGQTRHEEDRAERPTVDELGHDPVTGTVDLFTEATLSCDHLAGSDAGSVEQESAHDATEEETAPKHNADNADNPVSDTDVADTGAADTGIQDADLPVSTGVEAATDEATTVEATGDQRAAEALPVDQAPVSPVPARRQSSSRSGRPAVPSWDDIMFGSRRGRD